MKRIILRHLRGSKVNQVDEFPLNHFQELTVGRDPSATVRYDPDRDDLVGREHAKITPDDKNPDQFMITDLSSRNGTYVNKQRIVGTAKIAPGDVVQFGPGGPEFQFDLEPRPQNLVRPTRVAIDTTTPTLPRTPSVPPTRESSAPRRDGRAGASEASQAGSVHSATAGTHVPIGKQTVERMLTQTKSDTRKQMIAGAAALAVIITAFAAYLIYREQGRTTLPPRDEPPLTAAQVAEANGAATVLIEVGWHLVHTPTGGQLYHLRMPNYDIDKDGKVKYKNGAPVPIVRDRPPGTILPVYVRLPDNTIEPELTTSVENTHGAAEDNLPIGQRGSGTGFIVSNTGLILTNAHVAASWASSYDLPYEYGILAVLDQNYTPQLRPISPKEVEQIGWVPQNTKSLGRKPLKGKIIDGRHDYLDVTLAKSKDRIRANLVQVSDEHDVALIKIDKSTSLTPVQMDDKSYERVKLGDTIYVLGYPGITPELAAVSESRNVFNPTRDVKAIANPTLSSGNVANILRGQDFPSGEKPRIISELGDAYQLTINSTGAGNSGGPVFDDRGRVIGIFFASRSGPGVSVTYAIPIKFGIEMVGSREMLK